MQAHSWLFHGSKVRVDLNLDLLSYHCVVFLSAGRRCQLLLLSVLKDAFVMSVAAPGGLMMAGRLTGHSKLGQTTVGQEAEGSKAMHGDTEGSVGSQNTWAKFVADKAFVVGATVEGSPTALQSPNIAADWNDMAGKVGHFAPGQDESGADMAFLRPEVLVSS
jgi:hypothetical protein